MEPSLETEQRLAAEEAARAQAARQHEAELARLAQEALAQAAQAERQAGFEKAAAAQLEADLQREREVPGSPHFLQTRCTICHPD